MPKSKKPPTLAEERIKEVEDALRFIANCHHPMACGVCIPERKCPACPQDQKGEPMSNEPEAFVPEVGDWIMWNHSDGLRIGEVRFRRKEDHYPWRWKSVTSFGVIADERVLELRKAGGKR